MINSFRGRCADSRGAQVTYKGGVGSFKNSLQLRSLLLFTLKGCPNERLLIIRHVLIVFQWFLVSGVSGHLKEGQLFSTWKEIYWHLVYLRWTYFCPKIDFSPVLVYFERDRNPIGCPFNINVLTYPRLSIPPPQLFFTDNPAWFTLKSTANTCLLN